MQKINLNQKKQTENTSGTSSHIISNFVFHVCQMDSANGYIFCFRGNKY